MLMEMLVASAGIVMAGSKQAADVGRAYQDNLAGGISRKVPGPGVINAARRILDLEKALPWIAMSS